MAALFFLLFLFGVFAIPPVCRPIDSSSVIFCKGIVNYNISSAYDSALQDSLAKQNYDIVLNSVSACRNVILTDPCTSAYRTYACSVNFMKCDGSTLLPPCQELCLRYCEKCALGVCPCTDLPAKRDKPCFMLEDVSMEKPAPTHPISDSQRHSSSRLLGIVVIMFYNLRIH